ncbi:hypothetical protein GCM10022224_089550 [Nonomuraea antimicrobica]|uniref:V8-like Glu-specific endopeptidase n=1 Tax=Nonomuraea antimicrobica TaxID=561173 RepID=A0ABP7DVG4_9ACTN
MTPSLLAAPARADSIETDALAATPAAGVETAMFWLNNNGANLKNATPYNVQTTVAKIMSPAGGTTPDTKPGTTPPALPPTPADTNAKTPTTTSGKVFFVGTDGQPHWCTGTAVQSQYRNLVATAGHCVYNTQGFDATLDKWVFVPEYANGTTPWGLYVGKQAFTHYDFTVYQDYDRDYAFATVYSGVVTSAAGGLTSTARLVDTVGGQGLAWNQPLHSRVDVFGYPAGPHPDGNQPYTGETLESSSGRTTSALVPSLKAEELTAVESPFTGEGSLGSSWLLRYDTTSQVGYLNGITISVADTDGNQHYDTSLAPYFDSELMSVYSAAANSWTGSLT